MLKTMGAKMGKLAMLLYSGCLYPQFAKEMHIRGALILCPIPKPHHASKNNVLRNSQMCDAFKPSKKVWHCKCKCILLSLVAFYNTKLKTS